MVDSDHHTPIEQFDFTTDAGAGERARIGVLVLESDQTIEAEFRELIDVAGVGLYHSRLANELVVTPETLAKMADEIPKAARLLPGYLGFKSIGYGCTSGSTIIGDERVAEMIGAFHPDVPVSNPLSAAIAGLKAMNVRNLGLLTPYRPDVTSAMQHKFEAAEIAVKMIGSFYEESDYIVGRVDERSILQAAVSIGEKPDVDGVFISCTSLRAAHVIEEAEQILGKPVTASNHALAWHLLRLAGVQDVQSGKGRLFKVQMQR